MTTHKKSVNNLVFELQERAKELNCLYTIEDTLNRSDVTMHQAFNAVLNAIVPAFQYPGLCRVRLKYGEVLFQNTEFEDTKWFLSSPIYVQEKEVGSITVFYTEETPQGDIGPFLKEERKLLNTITDRLGHFILHQRLKSIFSDMDLVKKSASKSSQGEWQIVLGMIRKTDPNLFQSLIRKLLHLLCWKGVEEAELLMKSASSISKGVYEDVRNDENKPMKVQKIINYDEYVDSILRLAGEFLSDEIILQKIQKWIQEDKSSSLVKAVESQDTSVSEIADALRKYHHLTPEKFELSPSTLKGLRVSLLRRFFTEDLGYISIAKEYVRLSDFYKLIDKMIFPPESHGKLGGKSAGLFLASHIINAHSEQVELLKDIRTPKTWYLTSDGLYYFLQNNSLEEVLEQKYKDIDEVRIEYPHIVQLMKNSQFSPDIIKGLSVALDDLGNKPLVVRSSSLLEDQIGAAFSGKYKSLFLANQGTKQENLDALMDAIAEVYASIFSPDPIEYRAERGLLDFHEEMGIMIQEVIGQKVGDYYLPAFAGVAFSNNEFRWSPRIKREDGLIRMVAGLGTRAVDRLSDDYPILVAPGQPNLRVNISPADISRYSPKKIDVINLKTNEFETVEISDLVKNFGHEYPMFKNVFSKLESNMVRKATPFDDMEHDDFIVTFEGLLSDTNFVQRVQTVLSTLQTNMKTPIDIEFVHDGNNLYLLQCRPQSHTGDISPDPIPKELPAEKILFSANKYISNGKVPEVTHIVYVDPAAYGEVEDRYTLLQVGRAVGKLNKILPKRKFILMGPGRWGSRGDIKLGVNVTYSEINNTSMLVEIAKKKGNYVPDLSFGTHFFQDLVEASIRYLPLYPDDDGNIFNQEFLLSSDNMLRDVLPEFSIIENIVHVVDVRAMTGGHILKVLMNAEIGTAFGIFAPPTQDIDIEVDYKEPADRMISDHWRWRTKMAEKIASQLNGEKFGVKGIYLFGSTKNGIAGPGSDIDLIVHIDKEKGKKEELNIWFEGWSLCLSEMNFLRCGYKSDGLLDVYYITDEDIKNKTSYAVKIGSVSDAAKPMKMKSALE